MADKIIGVSFRKFKRNSNVCFLTCNGETKSLPDWAREKRLNPSTIYQRVFYKRWTIERSLSEPAKKINWHKADDESEYATWSAMKTRCSNKNVECYKNYGGRGIKVCERWKESFENFLTDMGKRPSAKHTIDRINNDGDYEPGNCRWATRAEQSRNNRRNVIIEFRGQKKILSDWAVEYKITVTALWIRLNKLKWSVEEALTTPRQKCFGNP